MPNYHRIYISEHPVFVTSVTYHRQRIFDNDHAVRVLMNTIETVQSIRHFELLAYVVLPDHMHLLIQPPDNSPNYSPIIQSIKRNFVWNYRKGHDSTDQDPLWQARFWDHVIRDDDDFKRHLDYIHWNPVKHGFVKDPIHWQWSSLSKWMKKDVYHKDWGCNEMPNDLGKMEFE